MSVSMWPWDKQATHPGCFLRLPNDGWHRLQSTSMTHVLGIKQVPRIHKCMDGKQLSKKYISINLFISLCAAINPLSLQGVVYLYYFLLLFIAHTDCSIPSRPCGGNMAQSEGANSPNEENCRNPEVRIERPPRLLSLIQSADALN